MIRENKFTPVTNIFYDLKFQFNIKLTELILGKEKMDQKVSIIILNWNGWKGYHKMS